ncbi:hypothetical protein SAY86_022913 [Trapa natans]|uniref:Uncharacterized protein n=1 Tax=Trapa natans TaxID=22666 RepID=A0AAN7LP52_TRANT|nr:hypothetical protein SAY86_022913 [Trapa natans]
MTGIYGRKFQLEAKEEVTHSSERKMNQRKRVSYSVQLLLLQVKKSWVAACEIKVNMIMLLIPSMLQACEGLGFPEMATDMPSGTLPRVGQNATGAGRRSEAWDVLQSGFRRELEEGCSVAGASDRGFAESGSVSREHSGVNETMDRGDQFAYTRAFGEMAKICPKATFANTIMP